MVLIFRPNTRDFSRSADRGGGDRGRSFTGELADRNIEDARDGRVVKGVGAGAGLGNSKVDPNRSSSSGLLETAWGDSWFVGSWWI